MRVPVEMHVSQISSCGSTRRANTSAVSSCVEDAVWPNTPLPAQLHARHRIGESLVEDFPLLGAGENAAHDVPQVDHHVPGGALVLEPVEDFLRPELSEARVLPSRQDVVVEARPVFLPRRRRQLDLQIVHVVLPPQRGQFAEYDRAHVDRLLRLHRRVATRRRGVQFREELIPFRLRSALGERVLALARADRVELPAGLNPAIGEHLVMPVAKEPVGPFPILPLVHLGVLNSSVHSNASCQRQKASVIRQHKQGP